VQFRKTSNRQDQYLSNLVLKVNTKCGGINHKVRIYSSDHLSRLTCCGYDLFLQLDPSAMEWLTKEPTMMVGIDVTHRGFGSKDGAPSIAAVVASEDHDFVQFPASLRIQQVEKVEEMLTQLKDMMVERLDHYKAKNGSLPKRIFVFRDGVSEV
jgi:eukaryotic translation initiation factor 2C